MKPPPDLVLKGTAELLAAIKIQVWMEQTASWLPGSGPRRWAAAVALRTASRALGKELARQRLRRT